MIQWFRGRLEAAYVGTEKPPHPTTRPHATHFALRLYRGIVRDVELIDLPEGAQAPTASDDVTPFVQELLEDARVVGLRGPGSSYHGPIFKLRVSGAQVGSSARKDQRSYGTITGNIVACCELPAEEPLPEVITRVVGAQPGEQAREARAPWVGELRLPHAASTDAELDAGEARTSGESTPDAAHAPEQPHEDPREHDHPSSAPHAAGEERASAAERAAPLFAIAAAIGIALGVSCGGTPALLWAVFMLPTLSARSLFRGVLSDSGALRGFGFALIVVQVLCTSTLISEWWGQGCRELHLLPLIGLVAVLFPSGLLPSLIPLGFNAAGLALVLAMWCGGGEECVQKPVRAAPASVGHPGVPRTNPDGSWPRRPPG